MRFVFNFLDHDGDGVIRAQDLERTIAQVNMDAQFGREVVPLIQHYNETHTKNRSKPRINDRLDFEKFLQIQQRAFEEKEKAKKKIVDASKPKEAKQLFESCLVEEILKKILSDQEKLRKVSVFICTKEEVVDSLKRRNPYAGLADAIIAGKDISIFGFETADTYTDKNPNDL